MPKKDGGENIKKIFKTVILHLEKKKSHYFHNMK